MTATLYDKLWDAHVVTDLGQGNALLYIDRQLLHEVSSPQAFAALIDKGVFLHRGSTHLAVADHAVPTSGRSALVGDLQARAQIALLAENCQKFGIDHLPLNDSRQGIVHVIGPEQGFTLPGITLVCGDSHTATHGAFGALAFGIGTSEAECVLRTQCLVQTRARNMRVSIDGHLGAGVTAKDAALALVAQIGAAGGMGHAIEYQGEAVRAMSMAERMTLCNMTIEAGARIGLVAPDETTFAWLKGRPRAPQGAEWDLALSYWRTLASAPDAAFHRELTLDARTIAPQVSWGTSPDQTVAIGGHVPRDAAAKTLDYMGLRAGAPIAGLAIDHVFIGSCTNGRIEDLRAAATIVAGKRVAPGVRALVVPGSGLVKAQAEAEGLAAVFSAAGFEWRNAGCSLCVAMNDDRLPPGARCASTSNRNFEGRQGVGARTHLMSPAMAAAAAIAGRIVDVRDL